MAVTVTWPGGAISAADAEGAAAQVMGRQSFGPRALWEWAAGSGGRAGCWIRYDGERRAGPEAPAVVLGDLRAFAAWSFGVDPDLVRVVESGGAGGRPTGAEVEAARAGLGLTGAEFAAAVGVHPKTVGKWARGEERVPEHVRGALERLEGEQRCAVDAVVGAVGAARAAAGGGLVAVVVPRTQEEYEALHPDASRPLRWARVVAARAVSEAGGAGGGVRVVSGPGEAERLGAVAVGLAGLPVDPAS